MQPCIIYRYYLYYLLYTIYGYLLIYRSYSCLTYRYLCALLCMLKSNSTRKCLTLLKINFQQYPSMAVMHSHYFVEICKCCIDFYAHRYFYTHIFIHHKMHRITKSGLQTISIHRWQYEQFLLYISPAYKFI